MWWHGRRPTPSGARPTSMPATPSASPSGRCRRWNAKATASSSNGRRDFRAVAYLLARSRKLSETRQRGGAPIEFWFDFASGYAYFAALEIEPLAERHGRTVAWRPFTLGAAFKVTGAQGLSRTPLKRDYARRDWQRLARLKGGPFSLPENHPRTGLPAIRAFYHLERK